MGLFDRLCDGLLRQVGGLRFSRGLPACIMQPGVVCLQLAGNRQADLEAMLQAHEVRGRLHGRG